MTERQFNADIAIEYLMVFSQIMTNKNQPILLKKKRYTLDNHQSDFVFKMQNMPKNIIPSKTPYKKPIKLWVFF